MAKLISAKLKLDNITQWINHELNGYPEGTILPEYRCFRGGSLQYLNPYTGWNDVVGHRNVSMPTLQPVTELEVFAKEKTIAVSPRSPAPLVAFAGDPDEFPEFKQRVLFPGSQVVGLLEAVKDKLLDWSIELGQRGIVGENMAFNEKEENVAKSQVFNIQNMHGVIGDPQSSQINIYDYSSVHQLLKDHGVPQGERNELETILDELKSAKPEEKPTLIEKGKHWISKNKDFLGDLASVLVKALQSSVS